MQYYGLAGLVLVIVALILLAVFRAGWRLGWLLPWLKGNLLLLGVLFAGALAVVAWELQQFKTHPGVSQARSPALRADIHRRGRAALDHSGGRHVAA